MEEKFNYFMEETNKTLEEIKKDVKSLLGFRMMLFGGSVIISAIISYTVVIFFGR
jgi:hypothetical protein